MLIRPYTFFLIVIVLIICNLTSFSQPIIERGKLNWEISDRDNYTLNKTEKVLTTQSGILTDTVPYSIIVSKVNFPENSKPVFKFLFSSFEDLNEAENDALKSSDIHLDTVLINYTIQTERKQKQLIYWFNPLKNNKQTGKIEKLKNYILEITPEQTVYQTQSSKISNAYYPNNSVLSVGNWHKFTVTKSGVYQIYYNEIKDLGIDNPEKVKIYGNGGKSLPIIFNGTEPADLQEIPISFELGTDGIFNSGDYILFYVQGPEVWSWDAVTNWFSYSLHPFTSNITYFITSGENGKRITEETPPTTSVTNDVNTYDYYAFHEKNLYNLIRSGREFYGEKFGTETSFDFTEDLSNLADGAKVMFETDLVARSNNSSWYTIKFNNTDLTTVNISAISGGTDYNYANSKLTRTSFYPSKGILKLSYIFNKNNIESAEGWLNYYKIWTRQNLVMNGYQFEFRDKNSVGAGYISKFNLSTTSNQLYIWDITDIHKTTKLTTSFSTNNLSFITGTDSLRYFIAFDPKTGLLRPTLEKTQIVNQNLHELSDIEYIIVSNKLFLNQANELANLRTVNDHLNTIVVTPEQIYNEFSSGNLDPAAIRNFAKSIYDKANTNGKELKYMLLFGDGSFDNKSTSLTNTNKIPTYESLNSLNEVSSYVSDDYFGALDKNESIDNGLIDIGIGRFPVNDTIQANVILSKIKLYNSISSYGDWRNMLCFIGDDNDNAGDEAHIKHADSLAEIIRKNYPNFNFDKIYLDAFQQVTTSSGQRYPDVNRAIYNRINQGALIINYSGHGNEHGLASELIIRQNEDIKNWKNKILPVFVTATCEFSRFDDYTIKSVTTGGEDILLNPNGGGIALFSTTRLVYASNNFTLNNFFYNYAFTRDSSGNPIGLGEIIRKTKNAYVGDNNKHNFTLLGDPALKFPLPNNYIYTDSINGESVFSIDTLKAFENVKISGRITDSKGNKLTQFNGIIYPTVYDKSKTVSSLNNDLPYPVINTFTFTQRKDILFKGQATVKNGEFSYSFTLPRDMDYSFDFGKISYYAKDDSLQASGNFSNFIIGGISNTNISDNAGPEIKLYLNDSTFRDGGISNNYPKLFAKLKDQNGINIGGLGIGHDLVATIDADSKNPIILNQYYQASIDDFSSGEVTYQLPELSVGMHSLQLKAWDILNNSATSEIKFYVLSGDETIITNLKNVPNPFTNNTTFYFEHNKAGENLDVTLEIINFNGMVIKTIQKTIYSDGFSSGPIEWDGRTSGGLDVPQGLYLYRVKVNTADGSVTSETKKLVKIGN